MTCDHPLVPAGKKNLVFQAADLIMKTAGVDQPISIHVRKRIPVGAGLGGGSSDAAATLIALNRLFRLGYSVRRLEKLGLSLKARYEQAKGMDSPVPADGLAHGGPDSVEDVE